MYREAGRNYWSTSTSPKKSQREKEKKINMNLKPTDYLLHPESMSVINKY